MKDDIAEILVLEQHRQSEVDGDAAALERTPDGCVPFVHARGTLKWKEACSLDSAMVDPSSQAISGILSREQESCKECSSLVRP